MGGRVAGRLREELMDEPFADTKAEATICMPQLTLHIILNSAIKGTS